MNASKMTIGKFYILNAPHDNNFIEFITEQAETLGIAVATFTAIGA